MTNGLILFAVAFSALIFSFVYLMISLDKAHNFKK